MRLNDCVQMLTVVTMTHVRLVNSTRSSSAVVVPHFGLPFTPSIDLVHPPPLRQFHFRGSVRQWFPVTIALFGKLDGDRFPVKYNKQNAYKY